MKLCHLPLRPSTQALLQKHGFATVQEVHESSKTGGSMSDFAAELGGIDLLAAASLVREIDEAVVAGGGSSSSNNNNNVGASTRQQQQQHGHAGPSKLSSSPSSSSSTTTTTATPTDTGVPADNTAYAVLSSRKRIPRLILTFSRALDHLLGGGVARAEVTEISGMPGTGKTQLAMQLCVNARLPTPQGGIEGEAVYIDTEGSFSPERCFVMAKVCV